MSGLAGLLEEWRTRKMPLPGYEYADELGPFVERLKGLEHGMPHNKADWNGKCLKPDTCRKCQLHTLIYGEQPQGAKCGCPHGCDRICDEQGRCSYCWNKGKGCPVLFHGEQPPIQEGK